MTFCRVLFNTSDGSVGKSVAGKLVPFPPSWVTLFASAEGTRQQQNKTRIIAATFSMVCGVDLDGTSVPRSGLALTQPVGSCDNSRDKSEW